MSVDGFIVFPPLGCLSGAHSRRPEAPVARRDGTPVHMEFKEE